jgi:cation-transporting ATPase 13A1
VAVKKHDKKNALDRKNMTAAEKKEENRRAMQERQEKLLRRTEELKARGVAWAEFKAMREVVSEEMEAAKRKQGVVKGGGVEASAGALAAQFEDMESGELPMVKLGDASIAAPFTSKMPSIKSCVDIVRQGRCTLVSSIQMVRDFLNMICVDDNGFPFAKPVYLFLSSLAAVFDDSIKLWHYNV